MENTNSSASILGGIYSQHLTQDITERTYRIFGDADQLSQFASKWQNVVADKSQGHMFEQLETIKFNFDALKKDSDLYAKTTASMGLPTDPVDIIISNGKKTIREIQAKSCNSAARSAFALSQEKYDEMFRLAPSDQHSKIEELLKQRIQKGTLKAEDYEQTLRNLKKSLQHDGIASEGTTYQEALDATNQDQADKIANNYKFKSAVTDMHKSGMKAGVVGASITGGISILTGGYSVIKGEKDIAEASLNTVINSAKGFATGYTVTAISKGITHSSSHFLGEQLAKSITRSSAPVAIAVGVVNTSKHIVSYLKGDIELEELTDNISHIAITSTSSFYYGALGQLAIPIPVVGALVGAGVGYFIGNMIHQSGLVALGDSAVVKASKERRDQIRTICLEAIPQIQKNRAELQSLLDKHFAEREHIFDSTFLAMDLAVSNTEPDQYIDALNSLNERFDCELPFQNFAEFDQLMQADQSFDF
ncbi:hypothetical protein PTE01_31100 [Pseudoalteromonas tetraodonis GFC]|uniref:Uncharacterized protein n=1 Tax=Pseudoalteromonas tetraodonis GFC TaxID=1315271 RepID=A0AA37S277_9GAMM|nr:hypothetical protein [Pseudoalteromonas tetraodonis]ATD02810.1 hypothetical protein PTET_a1349 [Pseudoalteromonas tetraodonis]GEN40000.1 hypothetical protein PTE01_31100 [Pseudoalteromonas tetraodonis GFC]GLQ02341.1 hypothetical protein GCM10007914_12220 [Pseudoalteromonas tetraodonis GFC]|tara:strand:- start:436 stop:1869 length:1434 start_codon:yes stop_codon:yes gene_type:complete